MMGGSSTSTTIYGPLLEDIEKQYRDLCIEYDLIQKIELSVSEGQSLSKKEDQLIHSKATVLSDLELLHHLLKGRSSLSENVMTDKERYLCITDGFKIFCLDLNKSKDESKDYRYELHPLPKIHTLELLDEGYPVSMGLFKVGSNAYMVGGHGFKDNYPNYKHVQTLCCLYKDHTIDNSPRKTYRLSLGDNNRLSLSECSNIGPLKEPILWPIVEKIDKLIHVIESVPPTLVFPGPNPVSPSHEVLDPDSDDLVQGWNKLFPECVQSRGKIFHRYTWSHLLVGDRIYGVGEEHSSYFATFDSKREEWALCKRSLWGEHPNLYSIKHVTQLLRFGFGRCVGTFLDGQLRDPLYAVIALGRGDGHIVCAAAYLVTPTGQVLCYQRLPLFFGGFLKFFTGLKGTVISADQEGKSFCAIVQGRVCNFNMDGSRANQCLLHVSMFTVEVDLDARTLPPTTDDIAKLPFALEKEFVKVTIKDWHAFELNEGDMTNIGGARMGACFL